MVNTVSNGGNLLLNVGPTHDGRCGLAFHEIGRRHLAVRNYARAARAGQNSRRVLRAEIAYLSQQPLGARVGWGDPLLPNRALVWSWHVASRSRSRGVMGPMGVIRRVEIATPPGSSSPTRRAPDCGILNKCKWLGKLTQRVAY